MAPRSFIRPHPLSPAADPLYTPVDMGFNINTRRLTRLTLAPIFGALIACSTPAPLSAETEPAPKSLHWRQLYEPGVGGAVTSLAVDPSNSAFVLVGGDMLGIGRSEDGGKSWTQADANAGLKGYEIAEFTFDPAHHNTIWAGGMDGPCKSTDGGRHWAPQRAGLPADGQFLKFIAPIQKVLFDPADANHLLAFGGNKRAFDNGKCQNYGAVWESPDGGDHWKLRGRIDPAKTGSEANITSVTWAGKALYASVPNFGVMRSDDGGASWSAANTGLPSKAALSIVAHPTDPRILWVALAGKGVFKTTDGGAHWSDCSAGLQPTGSFDTIAVAASDPNILYLNNNGQNKTFRSVDGGANWETVLNNGDNPYGMSLVTSYVTIDPHHPENVFIGSYVSIYHSTDGGKTWKDASAELVDAADNTWRGTGYSGLIGLNFAWNPFDLTLSIGQTMDDGKLLISRDNLHSWKVHHAGVAQYSGGGAVSFCRSGGSTTIYAALGTQESWFTKDGVYKSVDNGRHWSLTPPPAKNHGASSVYADPSDPAKVLAVFLDRRLYRSTDGGDHWSPVTLHNPAGKDERVIDNVTGNSLTAAPTRLYAAARGGIYMSPDGGATWTIMNHSPASGLDWEWGDQRVKPDPTNPDGLLVINVNGINGSEGIYRYDGANWSKLAGAYGNIGSGIADGAIDPKDGRHLVAICDHQPFMDVSVSTGVWESTDAGKTWSQQNAGLGMLRGRFIGFRPDGAQLIAATNGGGFYVAEN